MAEVLGWLAINGASKQAKSITLVLQELPKTSVIMKSLSTGGRWRLALTDAQNNRVVVTFMFMTPSRQQTDLALWELVPVSSAMWRYSYAVAQKFDTQEAYSTLRLKRSVNVTSI